MAINTPNTFKKLYNRNNPTQDKTIPAIKFPIGYFLFSIKKFLKERVLQK